jgi:hypothetical protein
MFDCLVADPSPRPETYTLPIGNENAHSTD